MIIETKEIKQITKTPFIVIDGVNGAGKSSIIKDLSKKLDSLKIKNFTTREPGGGAPIGMPIRELIFKNTGKELSSTAEVFLFCADRAQHIEKVITPKLKNNELVICDRFYYSTLAFQGFGRGIDLDLIYNLTKVAVKDTYPDIVILLDLDAETGLLRNKKDTNETEVDGFELEKKDFHNKLRTGFLEIANKVKEKVVKIDASREYDKVYDDCEKAVLKLLGL